MRKDYRKMIKAMVLTFVWNYIGLSCFLLSQDNKWFMIPSLILCIYPLTSFYYEKFKKITNE